jgi:hypothetical protein
MSPDSSQHLSDDAYAAAAARSYNLKMRQSKQGAGGFEYGQSNPYRPNTPLKDSIDYLRGQIQVMQKLQGMTNPN